MDDEVAAATEVELPLETAGSRLRRARELAGASLAQIAGQTRIGARQLAALEIGDYSALPGRTYAVGFAARPIGGLVCGHFGDRIGRRSMLVFTLLIAFLLFRPGGIVGVKQEVKL